MSADNLGSFNIKSFFNKDLQNFVYMTSNILVLYEFEQRQDLEQSGAGGGIS